MATEPNGAKLSASAVDGVGDPVPHGLILLRPRLRRDRPRPSTEDNESGAFNRKKKQRKCLNLAPFVTEPYFDGSSEVWIFSFSAF
jgi:hypothetical protein